MKALLEEYYAKKDEKFQKFVECFATGKSDENLGNLIQKLYEMALSNPFLQYHYNLFSLPAPADSL